MTIQPQILQAKTGVKLLCCVIYVAGLCLLYLHLPFNLSERYHHWVVAGYAIFGALWLVDVFFTRIELRHDCIRIVSITDFKVRTIPRTEIQRVTWEKGGGTSLVLLNGTAVKLPSVGRNAQGLTNTIRAWLNRTASNDT